MRVCERLRKVLIERSGLSVTEAAERLQIGRSALSNVVNGHAALSMELALKIESEFKLNARKLLIMQLDEDIAIARGLRGPS